MRQVQVLETRYYVVEYNIVRVTPQGDDRRVMRDAFPRGNKVNEWPLTMLVKVEATSEDWHDCPDDLVDAADRAPSSSSYVQVGDRMIPHILKYFKWDDTAKRKSTALLDEITYLMTKGGLSDVESPAMYYYTISDIRQTDETCQ